MSSGGANFVSLVGRQFGRLTVLERVPNKGKRVMYHCLCSCGGECTIQADSLRRGVTQSCGCLHAEVFKQIITKHGCYNDPLRAVLNTMRQRCNNPNNKDYQFYGARGVHVCPDWSDYLAFKQWALANGYATGLTIDRINPNGNYEPSNCRWITIQEQQRNRRPPRKRKG